MKRVFFVVLTLIVTLSFVMAADNNRSETIVFISGQKYYVHRVQTGETLYSLSELYSVNTSDITDNNSSVAEKGLQSGESIKIPVKEATTSTMSKSEERKFRKNFSTHKVSKGETLYAISREYKISVAVIVEDNPELNPSQLSVGQEILIRKKEAGKTTENETIEGLKSYRNDMNEVAPEGYEYHLVKPKETLYSLLRNYQMSRKEFFDVNDSNNSDLRAGAIVLVRSTTSTETEEVSSKPEQSEGDKIEDEGNNNTPKELQFTTLRSYDTLDVSLLLPLTTSGSVMPIFKEFYQGFLLGVEDLKEAGRNVRVSLFDTQRDREAIAKIMETKEFQNSDLIVGPVYEDMLEDVLKFAEKGAIPVVSPLATIQSTNSGALFQMAPIAEHKYDKIGGLLADSVQVALIYTDNTDTQYESEVKELLAGKPYLTHKYQYEHPSIVAERAAEAKRLEKEPAHSPSDLSPLIQGDSTVTIFIMPDNETDVDRILSALASAEIGLRSRSLTVCNFSVISNSKWNRYNNIDRAMLFRDRVTSFTSYHAKRDNDQIKIFDSRYAKAFDAIPSLYSYRGYDVAKVFGEGLYSDIEYGMEGRTFTPLQTTYRFQKIRDSETRANQNWIRANYKNNFSITIE